MNGYEALERMRMAAYRMADAHGRVIGADADGVDARVHRQERDDATTALYRWNDEVEALLHELDELRYQLGITPPDAGQTAANKTGSVER